jgi:hypothetical protein
MCRDNLSGFIEGLAHNTFPSLSCEAASIHVLGEVPRPLSVYIVSCSQPRGQTISVTSPVLSVLTRMAEDTSNQQRSQNTQNIQNPRRDAPRYHGPRRHHNPQEQVPRSTEKPEEKLQESKELSLEDEETEQDRSAAQSRQSRGGGRGKPPKRVIEEWANDIYCE